MEAVVFDLGGVLIDWSPRYLYRKMFDSEDEVAWFLETVCTPEWNHELDSGRTFGEEIPRLVSRHPEWKREIEAYYTRWEEMLGGRFDGSVRLLKTLREQEVPLYALTNWSAETFGIARRRFRFLEWFEDIVVSGEEGIAKPDRRIYETLVGRTGIEPRASAYVDDSEDNVRAADELGFAGIVFRDAGDLGKQLASLGLLRQGVRSH